MIFHTILRYLEIRHLSVFTCIEPKTQEYLNDLTSIHKTNLTADEVMGIRERFMAESAMQSEMRKGTYLLFKLKKGVPRYKRSLWTK